MRTRTVKPLKKLVRERIKVERLKEHEFAQRCKEMVTEDRPAEHQETEDVEQEWQNMKESINQIAKEVLELNKVSGKKKKKTVWWTEKVKEAVEKHCCF